MREGRVLGVADEVVPEEHADLLRLGNGLARGVREEEDRVRGNRVVELPVGDLRRFRGGVVDEVLERGAGERLRRGRRFAEGEVARLAPALPSFRLRVARTAPVIFVPLARTAAGEDVRADAITPLLLGVGDEVEHPLPRAVAPFGHHAGVSDVGEGVEPELVRGPVGRVEVDHHHEACVRARLHEILRLRVERGPVVLLEPLPDERILAIGVAATVDRVRREETAVGDAHLGELSRALQLLVEAAVRHPQLLLALFPEPNRRSRLADGNLRRKHSKRRRHGDNCSDFCNERPNRP